MNTLIRYIKSVCFKRLPNGIELYDKLYMVGRLDMDKSSVVYITHSMGIASEYDIILNDVKAKRYIDSHTYRAGHRHTWVYDYFKPTQDKTVNGMKNEYIVNCYKIYDIYRQVVKTDGIMTSRQLQLYIIEIESILNQLLSI